MKSGYKTTEFWLTLAGILANAQPILQHSANAEWNAAAAAFMTGIYAWARGKAKATVPPPPAP